MKPVSILPDVLSGPLLARIKWAFAYTDADLAKALGVTNSYIGTMRHGHHKLSRPIKRKLERLLSSELAELEERCGEADPSTRQLINAIISYVEELDLDEISN